MSLTTRQNILNNIKYVLDNVLGMQNTSINKATAVDLDILPFPSAFIYSGEEVPIVGPFAYLSWKWSVIIELWTKDDSEELLGKIHSVMAEDETRGGYAVDCNRVASDFYVVDADNDVKGLVLRYEIQYRHPVATP